MQGCGERAVAFLTQDEGQYDSEVRLEDIALREDQSAVLIGL